MSQPNPDVAEEGSVDNVTEEAAFMPAKFGYPIAEMTDRDLLEEIVFQGRSLAATLAEFQNMDFKDLLKMFMPGGK